MQLPYHATVDEDAVIGATLLDTIYVIDNDTAGENIEVTCINTVESVDACDIFVIEELSSGVNSYRGVLGLARKLNYTSQQQYKFSLKASVSNLLVFRPPDFPTKWVFIRTAR